MKLLVITRAYGTNAGGMERLSYEMVEALRTQPSFDIKVIHHRGPRLASPLFVLISLPKAIPAARWADHVHLGDPLLAFTGWLIKKLSGKPVSVTVHGLDILYPHFLYQLYLKLFFDHFNGYFPISQHVKQLLQSCHVSGRIEVLTPGINNHYFNPSITRTQLDVLLHRPTADKKILLTVGRLVKRKGHAWFIKNVFPSLPVSTLYVIAGSGPEVANIRLAAEEAKIVNRVIELSRVSDSDLEILYNTVDAFIQPNIAAPNDAEGFGLVLLEAALCQRPVFAANLDGIPDAIYDGHNGTLLPSADADAWITALQNIPTPSPKARDYTLEHFSWDKLAPRYAQALSANDK